LLAQPGLEASRTEGAKYVLLEQPLRSKVRVRCNARRQLRPPRAGDERARFVWFVVAQNEGNRPQLATGVLDVREDSVERLDVVRDGPQALCREFVLDVDDKECLHGSVVSAYGDGQCIRVPEREGCFSKSGHTRRERTGLVETPYPAPPARMRSTRIRT